VTDRTPDVVGHIEGYRTWDITRHYTAGLRLESVSYGGVWEPGDWMHAECDNGCTDVPGERCRCGIYAAKNRLHLTSMRYTEYLRGGDGIAGEFVGKAIGKIALAGKVIPGTQGWRAEKGRPIELWVPFDMWQLVEPLQAVYNIPVGLTDITRGVVRGHRA
jgi:hypothetical protein